MVVMIRRSERGRIVLVVGVGAALFNFFFPVCRGCVYHGWMGGWMDVGVDSIDRKEGREEVRKEAGRRATKPKPGYC